MIAGGITDGRHEMLHMHAQSISRGHDGAEAKGWDLNMLSRIIDERMTIITEQLRHNPTSRIEELLGLDRAQASALWRLDLKSVRSLKSTQIFQLKPQLQSHRISMRLSNDLHRCR